MTWLDKYIFNTPYYDKLLHAGGCGSLVMVAWLFTYSLQWSALIAVLAGWMKEIMDCRIINDHYPTLAGWKYLPAHWEWENIDGWDIVADLCGIVAAVGLIWWRTSKIVN